MTEQNWPVFTSLTSSVKNTRRLTFPLGPCTAFVSSENRVLKTALGSDSIRLALTGSHPVVKHSLRDLAAIAGSNDLFASLVAPPNLAAVPGDSSTFMLDLAAEKLPKDALTVEGPLSKVDRKTLIPTVAYRDLIYLDNAKSRETVFKRFGSIDKLPTPSGLDEEQLAMWAAAVVEVSKLGDLAMQLSALSENFRKKKLALGKEAAAAERESRKAPEAAAGAEMLPRLREELKEAQAAEAACTAHAQFAVKVSAVEKELSAAQAHAADVLAKSEPIAASLGELKSAEAVAARVVAEATEEVMKSNQAVLDARNGARTILGLYSVVQTFVQANMTVCPCCARPEADLAAAAEQIRPIAEQLEALIRAAERTRQDLDAKLRFESRQLEGFRQRRVAVEQEMERDQSSALKRLEAAQVAKETLGSLGNEPLQPKRFARAIQEEIDRLETAERARAAYEEKLTLARRKRKEQASVEVMRTEAASVLTRLLETTKTRAEAEINAVIAPGFKAELVVDESTCAWRVIGSDGQPHGPGAMSGSEEAALLLAIAIAWPPSGSPKYIILDDRDLGYFSRANLKALLETMARLQREGVVTQVFVAGTRPDEIPTGWTIHNLASEQLDQAA